mgnify:CR=1 FL=1
MRLSDYFPESSISVIHSAKDWQEAIDFSMVSLLDKNYISENYIQAINIKMRIRLKLHILKFCSLASDIFLISA